MLAKKKKLFDHKKTKKVMCFKAKYFATTVN